MRRAVLAFVILCAFTHAAEANAILFNDRAAFDAAVTGYQLFSDFPITGFDHGASIASGNYGGIKFSGDFGSVHFGETLGATSPPFTSQLGTAITAPVTAVGFDLVQSSYTPDYVQSFPNSFIFSIGTTAGLNVSSFLTAQSFFGVLLLDDTFAKMSFQSGLAGCACSSTFAIDNLRVQSVPEPRTMSLVFLGLGSLLVFRRQWRRSSPFI
jgi:hypothetical protein